MWRVGTFISLITISITRLEVHADPYVPCFFIFGDSISDAGNNNNLNTKAKANYPPYGIDFTGGVPTGRFSNGRTIVDIIAEHLGFQGYIPPFSTANGPELVKGVNYASGSAGIRPETGQHLGTCISLGQQLKNHKSVIEKLEGLVKGPMHEHLNKCLYTINMGSNDYLNNYFLPRYYQTNQHYNPAQFAADLINQYAKDITELHESGARKIAVFGLGLIGCSLAEVIQNRPPVGPCVDSINLAAGLFNERLKLLVDHLTRTLHASQIIYINVQTIQSGPYHGLTVAAKPCCVLRDDFQCREHETPCNNRNNYLFFDGFHPTEALSRLTGSRAFRATTPLDAYPYDISKLIKL